jgi:asparagine synthase (glutamine-hydrolysing)
MNAFAGIVSLSGNSIDLNQLDRAVAALTSAGKGRPVTQSFKGAAFVERIPPSDPRPPTTRDSRAPFAALARLDNREELAAALGLAGREFAQASDAALLQRAFERWGDTGVAKCLGAFAFAHWDGEARRLTLGRDCLGNRPLFYHLGPQFICFATTLGALFALPDVPRALDEIALANFIAVNLSERVRTFYRGIERVPSRTLVSIDNTGVHRRHYWTPNLDVPPHYRRDEDYIERARELFDQAVAAATRDTPRLAIATSGGLDSSAIAATVARQGAGERITCFCMVPPPGTKIDLGPFHYVDERGKVEALTRLHPALDVHFIVPAGDYPMSRDDTWYFVKANVPSMAALSLGSAPELAAAVARGGHPALLIGNYGNFGLSWTGNLALLELLRSGRWATFLRDLHATARETNRSLARTFAKDIIMPTASGGLRRLIIRLRGRDPHSVAGHSALNPAFVADAGLVRQWREQRFDPWFGPYDSNPRRWRADRLFDFNQYGRDTRSRADEVFGYEARDPHGDRRLLEFALSVPEPMYHRRGIQRWFARQVFADRLPRPILDEPQRGANNPTWFRSLGAVRPQLATEIERLEASPLANRLLDLPRLKRLMAEWPKNDNEAEKRRSEYRLALARGVHVGRFIRWVEGGNA